MKETLMRNRLLPTLAALSLILLVFSCHKRIAGKGQAEVQEIRFSWDSDFKGFNKVYGPSFYNRDDIYGYIDGGAEIYIQNGFLKLTSFQLATLDGTGKIYVVDIYRFKDSAGPSFLFEREQTGNEFMMERVSRASMSENQLQFVSGAFYVKVTAFSKSERGDMLRIAATILGKIE